MISPERDHVEKADCECVPCSWGCDIVWDLSKEMLAVLLDVGLGSAFEKSFS